MKWWKAFLSGILTALTILGGLLLSKRWRKDPPSPPTTSPTDIGVNYQEDLRKRGGALSDSIKKEKDYEEIGIDSPLTDRVILFDTPTGVTSLPTPAGADGDGGDEV